MDRPGITVMVDWALQINYLSINQDVENHASIEEMTEGDDSVYDDSVFTCAGRGEPRQHRGDDGG